MREPIAFVEIEQDFCNLTYGVAPCMAGIGVTGNTQCYNTLRTCQDTNNFSRGTKNLWFRDVSTRGASAEIGAWLVEGEFTAAVGDDMVRPLTIWPNSGLEWIEVADIFFGEAQGNNLFDPLDYPTLRGWSAAGGSDEYARSVGRFWRARGYNTNQGVYNEAFLISRQHPVQDGKTYRMRFLMRAKGDISNLQIAFFVRTGREPMVTPTITNAQPIQSTPSIKRISTAPTVINPGGGGRRSGPLGQRASLSVTFQDHPSSDLLTDPYLDERGVDALRQGTFWTKWLARNPYYNNRIVRVYDGYVGDELAEMTSRTYLIDKIEGPNSRGEVTLHAKDVLRLADNDKALAPAPSLGALRVDYNKDATGNIEVVGATTADYPASGTIRINREVFRYTGRSMSGDTLRFTGVTRATDGTERHDHKAGDRVQVCLRYNEVRVEELAREWLQDYAGVPSEYIPFAEWQAEADLWLDQFDFTGLITEPTGVTQLLGEICEQALFYIWWDERAQLIRMQAIAPRIYEDVEQIDDRRNIIADSIDLLDEPGARVSQVWVFWGVRDASASLTQDDNYTRLRVRADLDAEAPEQYDDSRVRKIYSRWIHTEGQAINLSTRILNKLRDNPRTMTLELDAKDRRFWTGDVIDVLTRNSVNFLGEPQVDRWQILSAEEIEAGHRVKYTLDLYEFGVSGLHGRWMEVDAPNYEDATETERLAGAWWADADGRIPDGSESDEGYMWI